MQKFNPEMLHINFSQGFNQLVKNNARKNMGVMESDEEKNDYNTNESKQSITNRNYRNMLPESNPRSKAESDADEDDMIDDPENVTVEFKDINKVNQVKNF